MLLRAPRAAAAVACLAARRTYFAVPTPSLVHADAVGLLQSHAGRNTAGTTGYGGARLTPTESAALGRAKRSGALLLSAGAGSQQLCNAFYVHCWAVARPYIAVNRHGVMASCDLAPLAGLGRSASAVAAGAAALAAGQAAAAAALAAAQRAHPGLQLVNEVTLRAQGAANLPGATEGSNRHRTPDAAPALQFTLFTPSREAAHAAALGLARALGAPTAEEVAARAAALAAARADRKRAGLVRRLARLAEDPVAVKNLRVPAGAIEGFVRARDAGLVKELR